MVTSRCVQVLDKMGIPQLRALFLKTFNHPTGSNNAEWLRKKLAQPSDPQVGAARAAVPRARDVAAEIWTTGTTFKGFTKQERYKLQQMGGNCAAKVVEVIKDTPQVTGTAGIGTGIEVKPSGAKRRKKSSTENKMHVRVCPSATPAFVTALFAVPAVSRGAFRWNSEIQGKFSFSKALAHNSKPLQPQRSKHSP